MIILSKTPCRVSLFGGGTDYEEFIKKNGKSEIISFTIDKFVYSTLKLNEDGNKIYNEKYRLNYFKSEHRKNLNHIENKIIKKLLRIYDKKNPYYISLFSDIPSGTGLGSSSAFIVGLIKSFNKIKKKIERNEAIYKKSINIERSTINPYSGLQDHASAVYGGLNNFIFDKKIQCKKYQNEKNIMQQIQNNSVLIWTKSVRNSNSILKSHKNSFKNKFSNLLKINSICNDANKLFKGKKFSLKELGELLIESYNLKKDITQQIETNLIYKQIDHIKNDVIGYKLLGAGGGGFILAILNGSKEKFITKHHNMKIIDFKFFNNSSSISCL